MLSRDAARPEGEAIVDAAAGVVRCAHRKVAIVGAGPGRRDAPWGDESFCWWALNEIPQPLYHRHFELHPMSVQSSDELGWLERCPVPCYVLDLEDAARSEVPDERAATLDDNPTRVLRQFAGVANAVQYPLERVLDVTGGRRYFTSTFSLQLVLAIADGFEEIGIWGVELYEGSPRERTAELACLEYWLGLATGRGVRLTIGPEWLTRRPYLYGYDYHAEAKYWDAEVARLRSTIDAFTDDTGRSGWRDVASAPRDGSPVLAWRDGWNRPAFVRWVPGTDRWRDVDDPSSARRPTHWLALPPLTVRA